MGGVISGPQVLGGSTIQELELKTQNWCTATRLLQVERDGNPLRRFGHASPFIGKLGPLDAPALHALARLARAALPPLPEPTLAIGMTESSLLLSWFVAWHQEPPIDLRFTTRKERLVAPGVRSRAFREPHSHGPQHFLALHEGREYSQILIVEDELTTGATLGNLLREVRDVAPCVWVLTLRDLRPPELRQALREEMKRAGVRLEVLDLCEIAPMLAAPNHGAEEPAPPRFNPFGREEGLRRQVASQIKSAWHEHEPGAVYVIGECVDGVLGFWSELDPGQRPEVRQVTRSPWIVDGHAVRAREMFSGEGSGSRYFLYNWEPPANGRALFIGEAATQSVGRDLQEFLRTQNVAARGIVVPSST